MSWTIWLLNDKGQILHVKFHNFGSTVEVHIDKVSSYVGTTEAEIDLTYNYSPYYYQYIDKEEGLRWIYGKKAKETISRFESAIRHLGVEQDRNYYKATPGNAGYALSILLSWAKEHPNGIWKIV